MVLMPGSWGEMRRMYGQMKGTLWSQPWAYQCLGGFKLFDDIDGGSLSRECLLLGFCVQGPSVLKEICPVFLKVERRERVLVLKTKYSSSSSVILPPEL
jgi:hypothetical protein